MPARTRASSRSEEFVASLQRSLSESQRWLDAFERIVDIQPLKDWGVQNVIANVADMFE